MGLLYRCLGFKCGQGGLGPYGARASLSDFTFGSREKGEEDREPSPDSHLQLIIKAVLHITSLWPSGLPVSQMAISQSPTQHPTLA